VDKLLRYSDRKFLESIDSGCDDVDLETDAAVAFGLHMIATDCGTTIQTGLFICFCKDKNSN
jgi:hypothetical protein